MREFTLYRYLMTKAITLGVFIGKGFSCHTLEKSWKDNKPFISCIPAGEYKVKKDYMGKHKYYKIINVKDRTYIEIHPANSVEDLMGCIAFGINLEDNKMLVNSKDTLNRFLQFMGDEEEFKLNIVEV